MSRAIGGSPVFLLGALAGSAITSLFLNHKRRCDNSSTIGTSCQDTIKPSSNEQHPITSLPNNDSKSSSSKQHRRNSSHSSDNSPSRRSRFTDEDESLQSLNTHKIGYAENPESGTNCQVISPSDWEKDEGVIRQAKNFEEQILSKLKSQGEMEMVLRRTRAVNALASQLTLAQDEKECFEVVSNLLVPLFRIDASAFLMTKDSETVIVKHVTVSKHEYAQKLGMEGGPDGVDVPLKGSVAGICAETLKQFYTPRTKESPYKPVALTHRLGLNTQLNTPIIINGDKFAGCIVTCMEREDGFSEIDQMLVNDVAHMFGASIYAKRLRLAAERSNTVSREMLHSMIPPKVIEKIECFWDESTVEYQKRRNSSMFTSQSDSIDGLEIDFDLDDDFDLDEAADMTSSLPTATKHKNHHQMDRKHVLTESISHKINLLNEMNRVEPSDHVGVVIDTSAMELMSTQSALYAETVPNVCIIFTDVVSFSRISLDLKPIQVMNMLQDLFSRFDALCDKFGIQKLETIGDAYICTSGMFTDVTNINERDVAVNALNMAKEMVKEARKVLVPKNKTVQTLEIRVGIHRGDLTCGVLGERLPKFTVFGSSVNLAARMEQTCLPSRIRITKDFFDLLPNCETTAVEGEQVISAKNIGDVQTYLLNPLQDQENIFSPIQPSNGNVKALYD